VGIRPTSWDQKRLNRPLQSPTVPIRSGIAPRRSAVRARLAPSLNHHVSDPYGPPREGRVVSDVVSTAEPADADTLLSGVRTAPACTDFSG
jgi:hypothetical protein